MNSARESEFKSRILKVRNTTPEIKTPDNYTAMRVVKQLQEGRFKRVCNYKHSEYNNLLNEPDEIP